MGNVWAKAVVIFFMGVLATAVAGAQPEDFSGRILDTGGAVPRASSAFIRIHIERYTTDDEVRKYLQVLAASGNDGLQKELWQADNGYIRIGGNLGYPLSVTRSLDAEGGRIIRILTDRPIQMFEVMGGLRTADYPFGILEFQLDAKGEGEGRLLAAARAEFKEDGSLEIESYGTQPFRLVGMRLEKAKPSKKK